jgi:hypothetical protein
VSRRANSHKSNLFSTHRPASVATHTNKPQREIDTRGERGSKGDGYVL